MKVVERRLIKELREGIDELIIPEFPNNHIAGYVLEKISSVLKGLEEEGYEVVLEEEEIKHLIQMGVEFVNGILRKRAIEIIEDIIKTIEGSRYIYVFVQVLNNNDKEEQGSEEISNSIKLRIAGYIISDEEEYTKSELVKLGVQSGYIDRENITDYIIVKFELDGYNRKGFIMMDKQKNGFYSILINVLGNNFLEKWKLFTNIIKQGQKSIDHHKVILN